MADAVTRMKALEGQMSVSVQAFSATAQTLARMDKELDEAKVQAVAEAAVFAVSLASAGLAGETVKYAGQAVKEGLTDAVQDSVAAETGEKIGHALAH
jgi:hypothetical protein